MGLAGPAALTAIGPPVPDPRGHGARGFLTRGDTGEAGLQSSFAPERSTTSAHLAESLRIVAANSSGLPPAGSSPIAPKRSLKAGSEIARLIAALSLSRIGWGNHGGARPPARVA